MTRLTARPKSIKTANNPSKVVRQIARQIVVPKKYRQIVRQKWSVSRKLDEKWWWVVVVVWCSEESTNDKTIYDWTGRSSVTHTGVRERRECVYVCVHLKKEKEKKKNNPEIMVR